jgi:uncharacterized protein (TIGR02466 family)
MPRSHLFFATRIQEAKLQGKSAERLRRDLAAACLALSRDDAAGRTWCREHGYRGYTSYASLNDLAWRDPVFEELVARIAKPVGDFARAADFSGDGNRRPRLDSLWVNVLDPGGHHGAHIHPHSAISGTYYVTVPAGASAIRFEDPRLGFMMAAPMRRPNARLENRAFVDFAPKQGSVLLWESWLRHEVPVNRARTRRISISFNYVMA